MKPLYCLLLGFGLTAGITQCIKQSEASELHMTVSGKAIEPHAFDNWCLSDPRVCDSTTGDKLVILSDSRVKTLFAINTQVNAQIHFEDDMPQYGIEDHWAVEPSSGKGDCEDYVLTKKKLLLDLGWPPASLLFTTGWGLDSKGNKSGHAILTVVTDRGDFILDNNTDEIYTWDAYTNAFKGFSFDYYARQSQKHQGNFAYIKAPTPITN